MAYLTPDELRAVLDPAYAGGPDTVPSTPASMSDPQLQVAIDDASAEVDARLAAVTSTPLTGAVPPLVLRIVRDIAAWLAMLTARQGEPLQSGDPVQSRYVAAEALLNGLAAGSTPLPPPLKPVDVPAHEAAVENPYDGQLLGPRDAGMSRVGDTWVAGGSPWPYSYGMG